MDKLRTVLFIKKDKPTTKEVIEYLKAHSKEVIIYQGRAGDEFPYRPSNNTHDILISYLSPWIIPVDILNKTKLWNINFHPAPPEYPGMACYPFAIYNKEKTYGVTAHLMEKKIDTGKVIKVKRFSLLESDTVYTLSIRSYRHMLSLFYETMDFILREHKLPECDEVWGRKIYTLKELKKLREIKLDMNRDEIERRIKATTYPGMPGVYIDIFGNIFEHNAGERPLDR